MIESYSLGKITIKGKEYNSDLIITPQRIISNWWREESHFLKMNDISGLKFEDADRVIVGKGFPGLLRVSTRVKKFFRNKKIKLVEKQSFTAVREYNKSNKNNTILMIHLTC